MTKLVWKKHIQKKNQYMAAILGVNWEQWQTSSFSLQQDTWITKKQGREGRCKRKDEEI